MFGKKKDKKYEDFSEEEIDFFEEGILEDDFEMASQTNMDNHWEPEIEVVYENAKKDLSEADKYQMALLSLTDYCKLDKTTIPVPIKDEDGDLVGFKYRDMELATPEEFEAWACWSCPNLDPTKDKIREFKTKSQRKMLFETILSYHVNLRKWWELLSGVSEMKPKKESKKGDKKDKK